MKANFRTLIRGFVAEQELDDHAQYLAQQTWSAKGQFREDQPIPIAGYYCVDVLGAEFKWMNEAFPKETFKWYLWFESVFLVPPEMATFLKLKWD